MWKNVLKRIFLLWEELKESIEIEKNDLELYFSYIMIYCWMFE